MQIPPLDLRQVELIKGPASALYGGGAIGGLVNLTSKRPTTRQEAELTLNQTTLPGHTADAQVQAHLPNGNRLELKAVGSLFDGSITANTHYLKGSQLNYYAEPLHSLLRGKIQPGVGAECSRRPV